MNMKMIRSFCLATIEKITKIIMTFVKTGVERKFTYIVRIHKNLCIFVVVVKHERISKI